ncbi:MAG: flagellar export protein FliJ [Chitinispirillales bacterium]|nr:flagellar export protein FliJ [Chitinispirillales bacterium]
MKRFVFKLDTLLRVKRNKEDEIKRRLAEKNREAESVRAEIKATETELKDFQKNVKVNRDGGGESVADLRHSVSYRNALKLKMLKAGQKLDNVMVEAYGINQELIKAAQERRAVEIIREKRYEEWKKENAAAEQKFIDDLSQQMFVRANK